MYDEINRQLKEVQQQIYQQRKIQTMMEELNRQKNALLDKVEEQKRILDKENEDVDKLEKKSMAHLFYTVLGKYGERAEKEQREALAAKLKYDQAVSELEQVNTRISSLRKELIDYRNSKMRYDSLYEKKRRMIMDSCSDAAQKMLELQQQLSDAENNLKEIKEAVTAGKRVDSLLENTLQSLNSAEGWGTWDLLGGGLISDLAKHSHIDDAKLAADRVQAELSNFRSELADVRIQNNIHFEMDGFAKFADFFFDGLIADWCMQSRIEETQSSVRGVENQVTEVLRRLNSMERKTTEQIKELEIELKHLIHGV